MSRNQAPERSGRVRIIAGRWRGRRVVVPAEPELRPTADRVRETVFNWLSPVLEGMHCLDLFAGTGVLGLEALSRGASQAWFVERNARAAARLEEVLAEFECRDATVFKDDAFRFLKGTPTPFDLVFLDPPFEGIDLENLCTLLDDGWLRPGAYIYLELSRHSDLPALPPGWGITREKTAGEVRFALAKRS